MNPFKWSAGCALGLIFAAACSTDPGTNGGGNAGNPGTGTGGGTNGGGKGNGSAGRGNTNGGNNPGTGGSGETGGTGNAGSGGGPEVPPLKPEDVRQRCATTKIAPRALRRLTIRELDNTLRDVFPWMKAWKGPQLDADAVSSLKFSNDARSLFVNAQTVSDFFETAKEVATLATDGEGLNTLLPCAKTTPDATCASALITNTGLRLFRRPVTDPEREEFLAYFNTVLSTSNFATAAKWTLTTLLQSPAFLYRSEVGNELGKLSQFEIATQLAYVFNGSTPSAELLTKAAAGQLNSADALLAEAKALLTTDRGKATLREFFREWIGYDRMPSYTRTDPPGFDEIPASMQEETRLFIDDVVFDANGNAKTLLTANHTFVNGPLSIFYQFGNAPSGFYRATRPAGKGIGILAQGSFLLSTSHEQFTSPVFRGITVYSRVMCNNILSPNFTVPTIDMTPPNNESTRKRFERHATTGCKGCHGGFDPLGFAFENFDEVGRYRTQEVIKATNASLPIDATGETTIPGQGSFKFNNATELITRLADAPAVIDCVSGLLMVYAFSGGGGQNCLAEEARTEFAKGSLSLKDFYLALVKAPSFSERQP